jgi:hypothetical protein
MKPGTIILLYTVTLSAARDKMTPEDRLILVRGMSSEFATAKQTIPRSKKPLPFSSSGTWDKDKWTDAGRENGPAARVGDQVRVTRIEINDENIEVELNGGFRVGPKWHERIQVGSGTRTAPVSRGSNPTVGTVLSVRFEGGVPPLEAKDLKKILSPVLDFEKRSATENYLESLPDPIKNAIKEKRALEGMDKDQVLMALGKPRHKSRETKDGVELEDWIYGQPPGRISFVTFNGNKVVKVKEAYAGLGGSVAEPLTPK